MERAGVGTWRGLCYCVAHDHDNKTILVAAVQMRMPSYDFFASDNIRQLK